MRSVLGLCCLIVLGAAQTVTTDDVVELTDANFEYETGVLSGQKTEDWLILFYAPWDPASRQLLPVWHTLAEKDFKDQLNLGRLDVSQHKRTADRFKIKGFPVVLLLRDDTYFVYSGPRSWSGLREFVQREEEALPAGYPVPPPVGWLQAVLGAVHEARLDVFTLLGRKPLLSAFLFGLGLCSGLLISVMILTLTMDEDHQKTN